MRVPLVEGEEPSALERVLVAADSGNGVSAPLDYRRWLFINADVSVALRRLPRGEWVCLDAMTYAEPDGDRALGHGPARHRGHDRARHAEPAGGAPVSEGGGSLVTAKGHLRRQGQVLRVKLGH